MFDKVLRKLRQLQVPIELELDDNGYFDRLCPFEKCGATFKVMFEDWHNIVCDEKVFCPRCRHRAESTEWNTPEQEEYIKKVGINYVQKQIGQAFQSDARRFNRSQNRNSVVKISMSYQPTHIVVPVPANAVNIMTQEFTCDKCNCRYASIGTAFFCPSCGHNSVMDAFTNSIETVKKTLEAIPKIRADLTELYDENVAQDSIRHICEDNLINIVSSFESYAERCFHKLPNAGSFRVRQNLFQNLRKSDAIWRDATGTGYTDLLDSDEYAILLLYFQRRNILVHSDGIVDQPYIDRSNDNQYDVGQRLVVTESIVYDLVPVIKKLADGLVLLLKRINRDKGKRSNGDFLA